MWWERSNARALGYGEGGGVKWIGGACKIVTEGALLLEWRGRGLGVF